MATEELREGNGAAGCPVSHDFDLFGPDYQADPAGSLREARQSSPVFFSKVHNAFVLTRHDDIRAVYTKPKAFVSKIRQKPYTPLCPAAIAKLAEYDYPGSETLGSDDSPLHMERRKRLSGPFSTENMARLEPRIRELHSGYIDAFVKNGHADLVGDLFFDAAAYVALEFMGVPDDQIERAKGFSDSIIAFGYGRMTEEEQVEIADKIGQNTNYSRKLIERIRDEPDGPGWLTAAVRLNEESTELMSDDWLTALGMRTLAAAHETTSGTAANAIVLLLRNREGWDALCTDPSLIPGAVEECLRLGGSFVTERRLCIEETEIAGTTIPEGSTVLLALASANTDDGMFTDAATFDVKRANARRHLTFGLGTHQCLGAPLARLQVRLFLEALTTRLPHMRLVEGVELQYPVSAGVRSPVAVPVEWDPSQNPIPTDWPDT